MLFRIESSLATELRQSGMFAEFDVIGRSLKAQMKYADKIGARFTTVIGEDDIKANIARVKNMQTGDTTEIALDEFADTFMELSLRCAANDLQDMVSNSEAIDISKFLGGLM